jgi:hypothetical protein
VPRVRRQNVLPALFQHLLDRVQSRKIPAWYKRFSGMTVCGEGELIKTFLLPAQAPKGQHVP